MAPIPKISEIVEEYQTINFEVNENGVLYAKPVVKNGIVKSEKRRVVPKYSVEMRALILERFYDQANHQKTDIVSVEHVQIDLVDFRDFAKENEGFSWLLTCICVFSKFLVAVPMKNKEAGTVAVHLIKDVFKILGSPTTLQSNNEELEEVTTTETTTIETTTIEPTTTKLITTEPTTTELTTAQAVVVENRILRMLELQESVNKSLEKYRARIYQQGSVHRKKTANNMIEAGATIAIAPDHDINPQTRKRKLQLTFS
ncbi:hypothetical protein C2G38_2203432 [Gigaspora rosea]|uniref:Integrase catalytic domain-containing protein n=1 Tax=Gigaspora rosea TaxID=44941 RepID=A0A397UW47_9GLOM|nr:hypothetical protein C2G38_2203432 [Gigaspora rosea]